jgi:hypothetical protein
MDFADIRFTRLSNQGLARAEFKDPVDVVRHLGAVQAQDYLGALWSIGLRIKGSTESDIEQAVEKGTILRTWPMRGTIHFVAAEDAKWMVELMAGRINKKLASYYRKLDLTEKVFSQARDILETALAAGPLPRPEIHKLLEAHGISTSGMRGSFIIGHLAQEGIICFGPKIGKQPSFALLDQWVKHAGKQHRQLKGEQAIAELMLRYFRSHGPAQLSDFTWWTGLKVSEAKAGLEVLGNKVEHTEISGKTYYFVEQRGSNPLKSPKAYLLQAYDEYTVAYKDRDAIIHVDNRRKDWRMLPFYSAVIIDGMTSGFWKRTLKKDKVNFEFDWLRKLNANEHELVEVANLNYSRFLGSSIGDTK